MKRKRRFSTAINKTLWLSQFVVVFVTLLPIQLFSFVSLPKYVCVRVSKRFDGCVCIPRVYV